ncbi:MAG: TrmH family RNA methyltransferase [Alphaproteobacteria bacterium]|nr:MAG: TrmH family RNA methyltransferase [Alphaproteobacteria bacterium]
MAGDTPPKEGWLEPGPRGRPRTAEDISPRRLARFRRAAELRDLRAAVVLEDIHDPHNAAAAFRSCDAFGVQQVHLVFEREPMWNPLREGKKTSGHTNRWLDICRHRGSAAAIEALKAAGHTLIATKVDPAARPLPELDLGAIERPAFVFGNEHRGISPAMEAAADHLVFLPMVGLAESFNLSVSVALTLYEYFGQTRLGRAPARVEIEPRPSPAAEALLARWIGRM